MAAELPSFVALFGSAPGGWGPAMLQAAGMTLAVSIAGYAVGLVFGALATAGNEIILMVKATSLASTVTLMEVTGIAAVLIPQTYRSLEIFSCAAAVYLAINFAVTRLIRALEYRLGPETRMPGGAPIRHGRQRAVAGYRGRPT